jgi:hypothetical protein
MIFVYDLEYHDHDRGAIDYAYFSHNVHYHLMIKMDDDEQHHLDLYLGERTFLKEEIIFRIIS